MNLADAYTACGWYKRGSRAQEEALCRSTTLSRSLFQFFKPASGKKDRYATEANITLKDIAYPMDMNFGGIYSPGVTVFRNAADLYSLMEGADTFSFSVPLEASRIWKDISRQPRQTILPVEPTT